MPETQSTGCAQKGRGKPFIFQTIHRDDTSTSEIILRSKGNDDDVNYDKAKTEDSLDDTETCGLVVKYRKGMTYECVNIWGEGPEVVITGQ